MPLRTIGKLLGEADELKTLSTGARRLGTLQALYARAVPADLAGASRVKTCKSGTLVICADNAAAAAKLRQLTGRLLAALRASAPEICAIRIEVQVSGALHERLLEPQKVPLGDGAVEKFAELSRRLPEGSLKSAVRDLVRRHCARPKAVRR